MSKRFKKKKRKITALNLRAGDKIYVRDTYSRNGTVVPHALSDLINKPVIIDEFVYETSEHSSLRCNNAKDIPSDTISVYIEVRRLDDNRVYGPYHPVRFYLKDPNEGLTKEHFITRQ